MHRTRLAATAPFYGPFVNVALSSGKGGTRAMNAASTPQAPEPIKNVMSDMDNWDKHKGKVDPVRIELGRPTRIGVSLAIPESESPHSETHPVDQRDREKHTGEPPGYDRHTRGIPHNSPSCEG